MLPRRPDIAADGRRRYAVHAIAERSAYPLSHAALDGRDAPMGQPLGTSVIILGLEYKPRQRAARVDTNGSLRRRPHAERYGRHSPRYHATRHAERDSAWLSNRHADV